MNELQLVLVVFALVVIGGILLVGFLKKRKSVPTTSQATQHADPLVKKEVNHSLNAFSEAHIPTSPSLDKHLSHQENKEQEGQEEVPEAQEALEFGEDFAAEKTGPKSGPKHYVIYDESLMPLSEATEPTGASADIEPTFGKPQNVAPVVEEPILAETREPKVFVIMVMGSHEFSMKDINQVLLGVGLTYTEKQTYAKLDTLGNEFIYVANVMEPGYFPAVKTEEFETFSTAGVAVILPLPTTVKAYGAMTEMITIARKVSQKLNGRLYDENRHLLKESDIQSMRDKAIEYETVAM